MHIWGTGGRGVRRIYDYIGFWNIFCASDFSQLLKYMAIMEELQTFLRVCSELRKQCMQGILISFSVLILLHYLTLKPIKSDC